MFKIYTYNFSTRIAKLRDESSIGIERFIMTKESDTNLFKMNPVSMYADPFLFSHRGKMYLFYEKLVRYYGKGILCMTCSEDLQHWTKEKVVLEEPYHLSFPYVFVDNNDIYMLPETGANGTIQLYKSISDNLDEWHLECSLIERKAKWADSSIIKKDGMYYLFSTLKENGIYHLYLFTSHSLTGPYIEHPKSPIYVGNDYGRNGGKVFEYHGKLIRPAQTCLDSYGEEIALIEITSLSPNDYKELVICNNVLKSLDDHINHGGHQFDIVDFKGRKYISYDYREKNYNIIELYRRIKRNLIKQWI